MHSYWTMFFQVVIGHFPSPDIILLYIVPKKRRKNYIRDTVLSIYLKSKYLFIINNQVNGFRRIEKQMIMRA